MSIGVVCSLAIVGMASPAVAATEGASCGKPGQTVATKAAVIRCATIGGTRTWVRLPKTPPTAASANAQLAQWRAGILPAWVENARAALTPEATQAAATLVAQAQADVDARAAEEAAIAQKVAALKAELDGLPAQIQTAKEQTAAAEAALAQPKADADAAIAKVNALSSSYSTAMNGRTSVITCTVLVTFGYSAGPCGSTAPYDAVIAQYNAASAEADAAIAKYKSYYDTYKAKYDSYKALFDRQATATNEYNALLPQYQGAQGASGGARQALAAAQQRVAAQASLQAALANFDISTGTTTTALNSKFSGPVTKWSAQWNRVTFAAAKHRVYTQRLQKALAALAALG